MADFEQVLSRAIAGLADRSAEQRRALYDRARASLLAQLKAISPPLPQTEIAKQRLALEHAIRKVEGQVTLQDISARDQLRREENAISNSPRMPSPRKSQVHEEKSTESSPAVQAHVEERVDAPEPTPPVETRVAYEERRYRAPLKAEPENVDDVSIFHRIDESETTTIPDEYSENFNKNNVFNKAWNAIQYKLSSIREWVSTADFTKVASNKIEDHQTIVKPPKFGRGNLNISQRRIIVVISLVLLTFSSAWFVVMSSDMIGKIFSSVPRAVIGLVEGDDFKNNKFTQRLSPEFDPQQSAGKDGVDVENIVPVEQTAILYEENPAVQQQGEAFKGQVLWSVGSEDGADGKAEKFIRGQLEIPQRNMKLTISIRRNLDATLPASHTVELLFDLPPDFVQKGISSIPGVLMKPAEQARGVPLIGASARITNSYFLIGLSNSGSDKDRNILMLKERSWLEVPILYESRLRAVLVMDKGTSGERMFQQVFASWKQ